MIGRAGMRRSEIRADRAASCGEIPPLSLGRRFRGARRLDALAIAVLVLIAAIAAATFRDYGLGWDDYTHSQYGDLLVSLYSSGFADKRALSFVNLYMYGGGFDILATLAAKVLPFGLFETRRLVGAAIGLVGLFVDLAAGAAPRRPARRSDRARPPRRLPALLRPHVHQRQGRAVRGGHGDRAARHRARVRRISARHARNDRAVRHRHRPRDRRARHGRLRGGRCGVAASAYSRRPVARERAEAGARPNAGCFSSRSFPARSSPIWSWAWSGRGACLRRSIPFRAVGIFLQFLRKAVARVVRRPD